MDTVMDTNLQDLNLKIDRLTEQVAYLNEQAQIAERQRQERAELVSDVTPLANQAFGMAVEQLEEVQQYIDLGDILRLVKRLLRNGRNLEKMLDQLESLADLVETLTPLADEAFGKAVDLTAGLEAKGYFRLAKESGTLVDKMVTAFTPEELRNIGGSIDPLVNMIKVITQPEVIDFANNALVEIKQEVSQPLDSSYASLLRQMRDPSVRRGIALTLRILHVIGAQAASPMASQPASSVKNQVES